MTNQELLAYRKQIITDAVRMTRKPDRTPHFANFWTWKILDSGYKLSEALHDWKKLEDCTVNFQKKYNFDLLVDDGVRNPVMVIEPIGESSYEINDEEEIMNIRDMSMMEPEDYDRLSDNFMQFLWEVILPKKASRFNSDLTVEEFGEVIRQFNLMGQCTQNIVRRLQEECGVPRGLMSSGQAMLGFEMLFNFFRGMQGISYDMRKHPEKVKTAIATLEAMFLDPAVANLAGGAPIPDNQVFHVTSALLGHTIVSIKQWEQFYWPSFKKLCDAVVQADAICYIFSEGSTKRFWDYFKELPKGHFAFHVEQDDIFEFKKELPNCCAVGGMPTSLLGGGTKEQCLAYAKHLIDELGGEGFILSQNKMMSFRNDANPENLKAVCDFVREYKN
jgi:hypothetical protein